MPIDRGRERKRGSRRSTSVGTVLRTVLPTTQLRNTTVLVRTNHGTAAPLLPYSQLRVIRKQENGEPPRFFGNFLDFPVSPPLFLRRPADRQGRKALVSRNWSQHPSVSFKNH